MIGISAREFQDIKTSSAKRFIMIYMLYYKLTDTSLRSQRNSLSPCSLGLLLINKWVYQTAGVCYYLS